MNKEERIKKIIDEQIEKIKPSSEDMKNINHIAEKSFVFLDSALKKNKIDAEVFLGGSLAKGTLIKKSHYDIDIFVRFSKKQDDISHTLATILGSKAKKIHGSRDYFQMKKGNILVEIIPVLKIKNPQEAENVTDLSYFHVNYLIEKTKKNKKLPDEIRVAKNFCYAQRCYGAESYIKGFSGYALELLISHYGSFLSFIKAVSELKKEEKIIIDDSHFYSDKKELLQYLNESKKQSPIILIDPTFKDRNALAGLSEETFEKFKKSCRAFLLNPHHRYFVEENFEKKFIGKEVKKIEVRTNKQTGDIAGTKSKKFFYFFLMQLEKEFAVKKSEFEYNEDENIAFLFFKLGKKKYETVKGPHVTNAVNVKKFKRIHPRAFIKGHFTYVILNHDLTFEKWFAKFKKKYSKILEQMGITELKILPN